MIEVDCITDREMVCGQKGVSVPQSFSGVGLVGVGGLINYKYKISFSPSG